MVVASSGWAYEVSASSGSGGASCGRPYRSNSWSFQVTSPVVRFSSKPPIRPRRWACCKRWARRAASSSMRQMSRTQPPCRLMLMSATAARETWPTSAVRVIRRVRNGSPVAYTRSIFSKSSLPPTAMG